MILETAAVLAYIFVGGALVTAYNYWSPIPSREDQETKAKLEELAQLKIGHGSNVVNTLLFK